MNIMPGMERLREEAAAEKGSDGEKEGKFSK